MTASTGQSLTRTAGAINNLLIVSGYVGDTIAAVTISDTQGNTWTTANPDFSDATNTVRAQSWYALAKNTLSTTVKVKTTSGAAVFFGITLEEFTGNDTTTPLDQVAHSVAGANAINPVSPAITLGANDCLIWSLNVDSVTAVGSIDGSAATKGGDDGSADWTEFRVLTGRTGASVTADWTSGGVYEMFIASFKPSVAGAVAQNVPAFVEGQVAGGMVGLGWM